MALAAGFLEAAWTGPGRGAPTNTWMGIFAILAAFLVVTFPFFWWIPALAVLEEITHIYAQGARVTRDTLFNHWSRSYLGGVNIYPYLSFPLLTILGQVLYWVSVPR